MDALGEAAGRIWTATTLLTAPVRPHRAPNGKWSCPCCGSFTLDEEPPGTRQICDACEWEDDRLQFHDTDYEGGANGRCLRVARREYVLREATARALERQPQAAAKPPWASSVEGVIDEARSLRGRVLGGATSATTIAEAARDLGLRPTPSVYESVDARAACALLAAALGTDLAYRAPRMEPADAERIAARFIDALGASTRFFTNGYDPSHVGAQTWRPATDATFDTGVLALRDDGGACLWVADED